MAPVPVSLTHFSDPHCPWAYSAAPAHAVLRWRFGAQLDWRLVLIGLSEDTERLVAAGYTPARIAQGYRSYGRRFGMPVGGQPRERVTSTGLSCRLVIAARLHQPEHEHLVFRALQLAQFTSTLLLDTPEGLRAVLATLREDVDTDLLITALDSRAVQDAYQADRALARTAAGTPTEAQGRTANTDGAVRYTAPSITFTTGNGRSLEVGGFQPLEAYDTALANLDPTLERRPPARDPLDVLHALPYAPTTREVAACMTSHLDELDEDAAEHALIAAASEGATRREALGTSALWHLTG
jgi:protein-disulfide isomerase-like protein with CxxC motif